MIDHIASWASVRLMRLRSSMIGPSARPVMPKPQAMNSMTSESTAKTNGMTSDIVALTMLDQPSAWLANHSGQLALRAALVPGLASASGYCADATTVWAAANCVRQSLALSELGRHLT